MKRLVVITGGSRGIGAETARQFVRAGFRVAIIYKESVDIASGLIAELNQNDFNAISVRADVTKTLEMDAAISTIRKTMGMASVLVNNVGISKSGLMMDMSYAEWQEIINVNLTSAFYFTKFALRDMVENNYGAIINVSSVWGIYGASCEVAYATTKAGLIGFTKALSKEVGSYNITVNCVAPGVIKTDMNGAYSQMDMDNLKSATPLERLGTPLDVAKMIVFLAGEDARFITGEVVGVSGGFIG